MDPGPPQVNLRPPLYTPGVSPLCKQAIEIVFTAFLMPALCAPVVWLGLALLGRGRRVPGEVFSRRMSLLQTGCAVSGGLLAAGGLLAWLGVPVERGGRLLTAAAWADYGITNLLFAAVVIRMTPGYAGLPEGKQKEALFLRFLGLVVLQPIATGGAFSILYRLLRVVYHEKFPWPDVTPEGI